jgi:hypothetical protein
MSFVVASVSDRMCRRDKAWDTAQRVMVETIEYEVCG